MADTPNKAEEYFNKAKQWFNDHGVGNLIIGAGGFAAAFAISMQAASSWMGGGTLSAILSVPIAFTAGLLGAVWLPGATNDLWQKLTGERLFPDRTGSALSQQQEVPQSQVSEVVVEEPTIVVQADLPNHKTAPAAVRGG